MIGSHVAYLYLFSDGRVACMNEYEDANVNQLRAVCIRADSAVSELALSFRQSCYYVTSKIFCYYDMNYR